MYGASAVIFGAFGAHGLKSRIQDPARIANWGTAAHYQVTNHQVSKLPLGEANESEADSFGGFTCCRASRTEEYLGEKLLHGGNDDVQREHLLARA